MLRSTPEFISTIRADREREAAASMNGRHAMHPNPSKASRIRRRARRRSRSVPAASRADTNRDHFTALALEAMDHDHFLVRRAENPAPSTDDAALT
jgi:hypothetical protein